MTVTTFAVFPPGCTFSVATTIACCPCHLVRVTSTLAVDRVAKFARRQLPKLSRCSTTHCGFLPNADDILFVRSCSLANVLPPRFPSFLIVSCLRVCPFGVSCLLGLTLRPSAPVCCCHRVSWTRGRLAFAQEAVRCPPPFLLHFGSACDGTCPVVSGSLWVSSLQATLMKFEGFANA